VKYLCVYVLWPSSVRLATDPGIGWDGTIIIFRKNIISLKNLFFNIYIVIIAVYRCDFLLNL
jgi:hypothetical protein